MTWYFAACAVGFLMLYYGAEWLVKGSSSLAQSLGITPIVIGLTVVAFGTSAPELVVSVVCSLQGQCMIAVGNVVGSNIANIALVLGLAATLQPITSDPVVARRDIPIMLGISLYLLVISANSMIGRLEGATLFAGIIAYTVLNYYFAMKRSKERYAADCVTADNSIEEVHYISSRPKQIVLIVVGIVGVTVGARIVVDNAIEIMTILGVSAKFIGLTIVAFGTSLPELATSIVAAVRKEMDISIGNLVGSNVFNILSVLGVASLVAPILIPGGFIESGLLLDYLVMLVISFLPLIMLRKDFTISRLDGSILLACYVGYIAYLISRG
ncbi:MAG: calcium/sodium antiporter [Desulfomonilaceae bacterium]|nr:calcium/sodium antiporter [Desulfomonilaceae bacterium]